MARRADPRCAGWCLALWALAGPAAAAAQGASASVVLRWQPVAGAAAYEVEVARDRDFRDRVVAERVEAPGYRWRAIPRVRHYWRVRSVDGLGRAGPWSETRVIEVALAGPEPVEPADGARFLWVHDGRAVTFTARASELLRDYRLEIAADPGFSRPLLVRHGLSPSFRVELPGLGVFHWRLGGTALDGREAPWTAPRTFTVDLGAPRLVAPEPDSALPFGPVAVAWETMRPAVRWRVTVERQGAAPRRMEVLAPPLQLAPERPGRYRVRVAAILPDGRAGPPSEPLRFRIEPPAPLPAPRPAAPADGAVQGDAAAPVPFAWESVPGATGYELQVGPPASLEQTDPRSAGPAGLEVTGLPPGSLAWRVRARDALGDPGPWSGIRTLRLGPRPASRIEIRLEHAGLVADGEASTLLAVRLLDDAGRPVPGEPSVKASAGRVEALAPSGDDWEARYVAPREAPQGGTAEIVVRRGELAARAQVELRPRPSPLSLGFLAGWRTNLAEVSAPSLAAEALWRTALLGRRLLAGARVSWYGQSVTIPAGSGLPAPVTSTAQVVPLEAVAIYEWPLGWATLQAGAGLRADVVRFGVGQEAALAVSPGLEAMLGASRPLGPGEVVVELAGSIGRADSSLATLRTGGLSVSTGYRVRP